ncbi:unnamed protein product, partial [Ectocarpus sp. 12 AP-2014]
AKRRCSECKRTGGVVKTCERQDCRTRFHPLCGAVLTAETQLSSEGKGWKGLGADMTIQCDEHKHKADEPCAKCGGIDGELVGCARCPTYYHKGCHDPPIPDDTGEKWWCATCTAALAMGGEESSEDDEEQDEAEEEEQQEQEEGVQEEEEDDDPEPPTPGSPEHIGWMKRMQKKMEAVKSAFMGKGKAPKATPTRGKRGGKVAKAKPAATAAAATTPATATLSPKPCAKGKKRAPPVPPAAAAAAAATEQHVAKEKKKRKKDRGKGKARATK